MWWLSTYMVWLHACSKFRQYHFWYPPKFCTSIVELSGGWGPYDGLLFIYHIGEWGNVSERGFNDTDATVVCRSLGYSGGQARGNRWYGEGMGVIWMSGVQCTGEESSLADCEHNGWRCHYCNHRGDVATRCGKQFYSACHWFAFGCALLWLGTGPFTHILQGCFTGTGVTLICGMDMRMVLLRFDLLFCPCLMDSWDDFIQIP